MRSSPVHERVVVVVEGDEVVAVYTAHESTEVIVADKDFHDVIDTDLGPASLGRPETSWDPKQVRTIFAQLEKHEREQDDLSEVDQSTD